MLLIHWSKLLLQLIDPIAKSEAFYSIDDRIHEAYPNAGSESRSEFEARIKGCIDQILNSDYEKILIVTHHGVIGAIFASYFGLCQLPFGDVTNGKNCVLSYSN